MSLAPARLDGVDAALSDQKERVRRRRRRVDPAVYISALAVIFLVAALAHVGQRAKVAALTYDMHQAKARLDELQRQQNQLLVQVERARALERIETEARVNLGMVRPGQERWYVVRTPQTQPPANVTSEASGSSWLAAFSEWYERVSTQVRAALPRAARD